MMATQPPDWIGPANNAFALDLYGRLAAAKGDNLFFSPSSIQTALAMTCAGARGDTAGQMAKVLRLPAGSESIHKDFGDFLKDLNGAGGKRGYDLSVANALWGQKGYKFLPDFLNLLKSDYGAGLRQVDFKHNGEAARQTINAWVEKVTRDEIKDLIGQGVLTVYTRLVLANAIYFKGTWADQFDKKATIDQPFHLSSTQYSNVPMMRRTGHYGYTESNYFQALELPYAGNELSMIILLPRRVDGLTGLEHNLTPAHLSELLGQLTGQKVIVSIPKFKLETQFELASTLESMGMVAPFKNADFSGMTGKKDLSISNVIHKAFVDVNEEGTEAAAATGVVMTRAMAGPPTPPPVFTADHPFFFVIRDNKSGAFLFMGRLMAPK